MRALGIANVLPMVRLVATPLLLLLLPSGTNAFPGGAGSCVGGGPAVGGLHLLRPVVDETSFLARGIDILIGGTMVSPGQTFGVIQGSSLEVEIVATVNQFQGALIRLEPLQGQSVIGGLTPGVNAQDTMICADPVEGITHINSELKTLFTGTLQIDEPGQTRLDITVVEMNSADTSIYMYGGFNLVVIPPPAAPAAPVPTPAPVPVVVPVPVPALAETPSPAQVATPSPAQVATPSPAQVATPSPAQVATPSPAQVATPSPAQVATPSPAGFVPTPSPAPSLTLSPLQPATSELSPSPASVPVPVPVTVPAPVALPVPETAPVPVPVPAYVPTGDDTAYCSSSKDGKGGKGGESSKAAKCSKKKKKKSKKNSKKSNKILKSSKGGGKGGGSSDSYTQRRRGLRKGE